MTLQEPFKCFNHGVANCQVCTDTNTPNLDTYKCVACGHIEKIDDLSSIRCPKCHYKGLEPVIDLLATDNKPSTGTSGAPEATPQTNTATIDLATILAALPEKRSRTIIDGEGDLVHGHQSKSDRGFNEALDQVVDILTEIFSHDGYLIKGSES